VDNDLLVNSGGGAEQAGRQAARNNGYQQSREHEKISDKLTLALDLAENTISNQSYLRSF
jgi:hypothetical protein